MTTPALWKTGFLICWIVPALGLNYDPSPLCNGSRWTISGRSMNLRKKYSMFHFKDIKLYPEKLNEVGIMAAAACVYVSQDSGPGGCEMGPSSFPH